MLSSAKFEYLIKQHKKKVYNYAVYMLKNQMDAEDITQEVLIRTWQNIDGFNFLAAKAWIMRTTHNLCIDYLRRNRSIYHREIQLEEDIHDEIADSEIKSNPEISLDKIISEDLIKEAIENLPERLRSVFVLYELQQFKYKEISEMLDIPINTVKVNILRARKQLQKELKVYAQERFN